MSFERFRALVPERPYRPLELATTIAVETTGRRFWAVFDLDLLQRLLVVLVEENPLPRPLVGDVVYVRYLEKAT